MTKIFNHSLNTGIFPSDFKIGKITALHKSGDRSDISNYRPISVLPALSKILEKAVHEQVYKHMSTNNYLSDHQSGFRPKRSTDTALTWYTDKIYRNMGDKKATVSVYLDLAKAFDTVNHEMLLLKLKSYGITGTAHDWFSSYLSNRKQQVCVNGQLSSPSTVTMGVPQGSILGPLAFIIFINDLPSAIKHSEVHMYADDTVIFLGSDKPDYISKRLSSDLNAINDWFTKNHLSLNVSKTKFMIYGTNALKKRFSNLRLDVGGELIERVHNFKYLGVIFDENLTWDNHIEYVHSKASSRLYLFKRLRHHLDKDQAMIVFSALVQSVMDYADTVWSSCSAKSQNLLQKLQNKGLRSIHNIPDSLARFHSISDLLHQTGWTDLATRRKARLCVLTYKTISGDLPSYMSEMILPATTPAYCTRSTLRRSLHVPRTLNRTGDLAFSVVAPNLWNSFDHELSNAASLRNFKTLLQNYLKKH